MSEENVERLRAAYVAWNHLELGDFLAGIAPGVVFYTSGIFPSHDPVYRGPDGMQRFWETFHDAWERLDIEVARFEDLGGDQVLALIRFEAVGRESGVEVGRKLAHLVSFNEGLVTEIRAYADWDEALEAAGLRE
jgi:hypothetical protein